MAVEIVPGFLEERLEEDEDVLEIPVFVRIEFESEVGEERGVGDERGRGERERREEAFWVVVGVGRIKGGGS